MNDGLEQGVSAAELEERCEFVMWWGRQISHYTPMSAGWAAWQERAKRAAISPPKAQGVAPGFQAGALFAWNCLDDIAARVNDTESSNTIREFLMRAWHHEVLSAVRAATPPVAGAAGTVPIDEGESKGARR